MIVNYLKPRLQIYITLNDFEAQSKESTVIIFDDLSVSGLCFVVGNAGFGKSRLLKEILIKESETANHFINLKTVEEGTKLRDVIESSGFDKGKDDNFYMCFDSLDEVAADRFSDILNEILNFSKLHPNATILVSCRSNHVTRNGYLLGGLKLTIIEILPLSVHQIVNQLMYEFDELKSESPVYILDLVSNKDAYRFTSDGSAIIKIPRYFEFFISLSKKHRLKEVAQWTRAKLIGSFISSKLSTEEQKSNARYNLRTAYYSKVLEDLALTLEIQRTNRISKRDFVIFLFENNIGLGIEELMDDFWDRTVLRDTDEFITFENTEFQEYLAAKSLSDFDKLDQIILDISVEKGLLEIYPSWLDVIGFVIELNPPVLISIMNFGLSYAKKYVFGLINWLPLNEFEGKEQLQRKLFDEVYGFFNQTQELFVAPIEFVLSRCFLPQYHKAGLMSIIRGSDLLNDYSKSYNLLLLLKYVVTESSNFSTAETQEIQQIVFKLALLPIDVKKDTIQTFALSTLASFKTIPPESLSELRRVYFERRTNSISDAIVRIFSSVAPNQYDTIYLYSIQLERSQLLAEENLNNIDTVTGFLNLFKILKEQRSNSGTAGRGKSFLTGLNRANLMHASEFVRNLSTQWDDEIQNEIIQFIIDNYSESGFNGSFIQVLTTLLVEKEKDILKIIIGRLEVDGVVELNYYNEKLLRDLTPLEGNPWLQERLRNVRRGSDFYDSLIARATARIGVKTEAEKAYDLFIQLLDDSDHNAFKSFNKLPEAIRSTISTEDKGRVSKLANDLLIKESTKQDSEFLEETIVEAVNSLDITDFAPVIPRKFWVNIIADFNTPLNRHLVDKITELILPMDSDLETFIEDTFESMADFHSFRNLILFFEKVKIKKAPDFLLDIFNNSPVNSYDKVQIVNSLSEINMGSDFVATLFEKNNDVETASDEEFHLLLALNKYQLKSGNDSAVVWLVNGLKQSFYQEKLDLNRNGILRPGNRNRGGDLSKNIDYINDPKYRSHLNELLSLSFEKLDESIHFESFINWRIWYPIREYYERLKKYKPQLKYFITELETFLNDQPDTHGLQDFRYRVDNLRRLYIKELSEPRKLFESIKLLKHIKQKEYLDISSSYELFMHTKDILNFDFRQWVEEQGGYKIFESSHSRVRETFIQKVCVPIIMNLFLERQFNRFDIVYPIDFSMYREVQTPKDDRVDLLIAHGSAGRVLIEIKRGYNIPSFDYRTSKMLPYMSAMQAEYGIFLIIVENELSKPKKAKLELFIEHYRQDKNIEVVVVDSFSKAD